MFPDPLPAPETAHLLTGASVTGRRSPQAGRLWDLGVKHVFFAFLIYDNPRANLFISLPQLLLV